MTPEQLEQILFEFTKSELKYQKSPDHISNRYKKISNTIINNEKIYHFDFIKHLKESNIYINKESRFIKVPKHVHSVIELNYVYSGKCCQIINGEEVRLQEGDVCILDTNTVHEILPLSKNDIIITIAMKRKYFTDGFLLRLSSKGLVSQFLVNALSSKNNAHQYMIFRRHKKIPLRKVIQDLLCEYYDNQISRNEIMDSYVAILFSYLIRTYEKSHKSSYVNKSTVEPILDILKHIENNYKTVTLKSVAESFGYHPNYLSTYIKKHTGENFKQLIITQKMVRASFYLKNSDEPISDIAERVGYQNIGFFYQKFNEHYHMSPSQFRRLENIN